MGSLYARFSPRLLQVVRIVDVVDFSAEELRARPLQVVRVADRFVALQRVPTLHITVGPMSVHQIDTQWLDENTLGRFDLVGAPPSSISFVPCDCTERQTGPIVIDGQYFHYVANEEQRWFERFDEPPNEEKSPNVDNATSR